MNVKESGHLDEMVRQVECHRGDGPRSLKCLPSMTTLNNPLAAPLEGRSHQHHGRNVTVESHLRGPNHIEVTGTMPRERTLPCGEARPKGGNREVRGTMKR
ncbi:hypothetical protein DL546_002392 [Coniochaeta pulveracea]|uniref:Uncharacterized protein n=1 Tax=Coniochaeta pulveracea TaxID=177199 RepID=A0A420XYT0_9PEZI|nr:hypothetical protein DL546_002392 [Coniochaeta pulveracea]